MFSKFAIALVAASASAQWGTNPYYGGEQQAPTPNPRRTSPTPQGAVAAPPQTEAWGSDQWGAPSAPASDYWTPEAPASHWGGPPAAPESQWGGPPAAPESHWGGPPAAPESHWGAPAAPENHWGMGPQTPQYHSH